MLKQKEHWLWHLEGNSAYQVLRFKKLDNGFYGYPPFDISESYLDVVDLKTFIKKEPDRLPLFIGTQFGLYPYLYDYKAFYNEDKIIAVLGYSILTGIVSGLRLIEVNKFSIHGCFSETDILVSFKNES
jgi:hypothetical protein